MIVQFIISNFKSFKKQTTINFIESRITEFADTLYVNQNDGFGLVPLSVIYGPNGGGKSNLLEALAFLGNTTDGVLSTNPYYLYQPTYKTRPTEFEITFRCENKEYNYQLKTAQGLVLEETLFSRELPAPNYDVVFDRDQDGVFLGTELEHTDINELTDQYTMFSFLTKWNIATPVDNALQYLKHLTLYTTSIEHTAPIKAVCGDFQKKAQLCNHLKNLGIMVDDFIIKEDSIFVAYEPNVTLPLCEESSGIRKIIELLSFFLMNKEQESILLIDAINAHLHPQVLQYFYELFTIHRDASTTCQLLCTANDFSTMNNSVLRRDEIWLCSNTKSDGSIIYPLAEFIKENGDKVRKDETYFKQYLEGRYGALPSFSF